MPFTLKKDLLGRRFGLLTVTGRIKKQKKTRNRYFWACRCDCGGEKLVSTAYLNRGWTKSCGCLWRKSRLSTKEAETRILFGAYRTNAKNRDHSFQLSLDQFRQLVFSNCYYCGSKPDRSQTSYYSRAGRASTLFNGIDRQDNGEGYVFENCVPCCKLCNYMKRSLDVETFLKHVRQISGFGRDEEGKAINE